MMHDEFRELYELRGRINRTLLACKELLQEIERGGNRPERDLEKLLAEQVVKQLTGEPG